MFSSWNTPANNPVLFRYFGGKRADISSLDVVFRILSKTMWYREVGEAAKEDGFYTLHTAVGKEHRRAS
jgi:hypothetical protein